jgi:hypothetical protein
VFKLERAILKWLVNKPSSDADARRLARGEAESFATWSVEGRTQDQLLMCDFQSRTRSWLMVVPLQGGVRHGCTSAQRSFRVDRSLGDVKLGSTYKPLLGFRKLYSRMLLSVARSRLA